MPIRRRVEVGQFPRFDRAKCRRRDAERFPDNKPDSTPIVTPPSWNGPPILNACIGECEERHHDKRREVVERVFETQNRRGHSLARMLNREDSFLLSLAGQDKNITALGAIESIQKIVAPAVRNLPR
jgi:hypothetical protein